MQADLGLLLSAYVFRINCAVLFVQLNRFFFTSWTTSPALFYRTGNVCVAELVPGSTSTVSASTSAGDGNQIMAVRRFVADPFIIVIALDKFYWCIVERDLNTKSSTTRNIFNKINDVMKWKDAFEICGTERYVKRVWPEDVATES